MTTINTVTLWRQLSPAQQERFGALAVALLFATAGVAAWGDGKIASAAESDRWDTVFDEASHEMEDFTVAHFANWFDAAGIPAMPDLNPLGIRQCVTCGCTEHHACIPPCAWAGPTLCTACAQPSPAPEAA